MGSKISPKPIIVDTDMAADDWMALLYLLQSPHADIRAITVAATGEAHTWFGVRNALRLLKLSKQTGIPVTAGRSSPLQGNNRFPLTWRIAMDLRFLLPLPWASQKRDPRSAIELLAELLEKSAEPLTIVALGPLTNLGELTQTHPELLVKIDRVVVMGGALDVLGNLADGLPNTKNVYAEWNIYVDPHAANLLFRSGVPVTLVPLDVTNRTPVTASYLQRFAEAAVTPAAQFVNLVLKRLEPIVGTEQFFFWDPLTAVLATHPELGSYRSCPVRVIETATAGDQCGRTVVADDGPVIEICHTVDQATFEQLFIDTINLPYPF